MYWLGTSVAIFANTLIPLQKDIHTYTEMTVDFSVVLITEKGQDSLVYLLYCLLHYTKMISFSTASFLEETGNISIESFKKKTIHAKDKREGGKKLFTMIHHCKGSACNCLSLLSPWVMDLTGVRVS